MGCLLSSGPGNEGLVKVEFDELKGLLPFSKNQKHDEHKKNIIDALKKSFEEKVDEVKHGVSKIDKVLWDVSKAIDHPFRAKTCIPNVYAYNGVHEYVEEFFEGEVDRELPIGLEVKTFFKDAAEKLVQKPRTIDEYKNMWDVIACHVGFDKKGAFPEIVDSALLKIMLTTNPFVTAGLSYEGGKICFNATKDSRNQFTARIFSNFIEQDYANSKVYISNDLKELELFVGNDQVLADSDGWDKACSKFVTCLLYYFEIIHAVLHVYAYIILGCAIHCCAGTDMSSFMSQYTEKVLIKYIEVKKLLIGKKGVVTGAFDAWPVEHEAAMKCTTFIFKHIAKWKDANDWMYKFFLCGVPELEQNNLLLPELRTYFQRDIFKNMSRGAWELVPDKAKGEIDGSIQSFLRHCSGDDASENFFTMTTFRDWIEVQSMLGILHGSTLNISRLVFTPYCIIDGLWDRKDIGNVTSVMSIVVGTMCGLQEEFAFAKGTPLKNTIFHQMMSKFNDEVSNIQSEYWRNLSDDVKEKYGWWYSVWGQSDTNMKYKTQLTVTTYV